MSPKILEIYIIQNWIYSYFDMISVKKLANYQTDRPTRNSELFGYHIQKSQEMWNNFEKVQKYPGNVSKKFQKDISSRTGDIPI